MHTVLLRARRGNSCSYPIRDAERELIGIDDSETRLQLCTTQVVYPWQHEHSLATRGSICSTTNAGAIFKPIESRPVVQGGLCIDLVLSQRQFLFL
jgi:hypothetical protein